LVSCSASSPQTDSEGLPGRSEVPGRAPSTPSGTGSTTAGSRTPKALPAIERYLGYRLAPPVAEIGARLQAWRKQNRLSLVEASHRLEVDSHTLSDLEHGREVTLPVRLKVEATVRGCVTGHKTIATDATRSD
jgi:hypothetical protein